MIYIEGKAANGDGPTPNTYLNTEMLCIRIENHIGHVFDICSVFEKYLRIQSNTHNISNKR